jgi:nitroimidazol reductase NimA-like FMN-containing flavoprotein (pyridoxamine 5'-phosphate oxidase superfamily)
MVDTCRSILEGNDLCVLATQGKDAPHTSLMSYVSGTGSVLEEDTLAFVTLQNTTKYANISRAPRVSVLVDTRLQHCCSGPSTDHRADLHALTIHGHATELHGEDRKALLLTIQEKHPQVAAICAAPDAAVFVVHVMSYQLLRGALDVFHVQVREEHDLTGL